jgi:hypothetical protein
MGLIYAVRIDTLYMFRMKLKVFNTAAELRKA